MIRTEVTLTQKGLRVVNSKEAAISGKWDTDTVYNAKKEGGQWVLYNPASNLSVYVDETCVNFVNQF